MTKEKKGKRSEGSFRLPLILLQDFGWFLIPIVNPIVICIPKAMNIFSGFNFELVFLKTY